VSLLNLQVARHNVTENSLHQPSTQLNKCSQQPKTKDYDME